MSGAIHEFQPEEVMAYLDGEVTGEHALALADHLEHCAECSSLAGDFCALSQQLVAWKIESSPLVESPAILGVETPSAEEVPGAFKSDGDSHPAFLPSLESAPRAGRKASLLSSFFGSPWRPVIRRPWVWALASICAMVLIASSLSLRMGKLAPRQSVPANFNHQTKTQNAERDLSPTIGPAPTSGMNFGGARARSTMVPVDAADATDKSVNGLRASASPGDTMASRRIDNLPLNGRNYIDFTILESRMPRDASPSIGMTPLSSRGDARQMIEKTASLSLSVKEMDAARA